MQQHSPGDRLKAFRSRSGLSQQELADASGLSLRSIQRIENGKTAPRGDSLLRIAKALNISIEALTDQPQLQHLTPSPALREDPKISLILILSAFGYVINPILGLIFPFIVWIFFRNSVNTVNETGLRVIRFQLLWLIILVLVSVYLFGNKLFNLNLPMPENNKSMILIFSGLYIGNAVVIITFIYSWMKKRKSLQKA